MITIFDDQNWSNAHELFQEWRLKNADGQFINRASRRRGMLHRCGCAHLGSCDWRPNEYDRASLTRTGKVCSRTVDELNLWAKRHRLRLEHCKTCKPGADGFRLLSEAKYRVLMADLDFQAEAFALQDEFSGVEKPGRVESKIYRILRKTRLAERVKTLHGHACQICGKRIKLSDGSYYAEAHHIQPLGSRHNGPDDMRNLLCLCPNHHVEMDFLTHHVEMKRLRVAKGHEIGAEFIEYHNSLLRPI